jgi:MFS family permease
MSRYAGRGRRRSATDRTARFDVDISVSIEASRGQHQGMPFSTIQTTVMKRRRARESGAGTRCLGAGTRCLGPRTRCLGARTRYLTVLATAILCYAALGTVLGILPGYVHSLGGGAVLVGFAVGAPALTGALGRPQGGRIADRIGPARVVIAGALVMAVGTIPAYVTALPVLIVSRLAVGAGEAAMMAATVLWLLRLAGPERRGRAMGHIGLANYAGLTVGPPLSQALVGQTHPTRVWITAAILPLLGAALAFVMARGKDEAAHAIAHDVQAKLAPTERSGEGTPGGEGTPSGEGTPGGEGTPSGEGTGSGAAAHSAFRATLRPGLGLMLVNFGYVALLSFGAAAASEQKSGVAAFVIPVFGAGVIASRTILAGIPDRFGPARTLSAAVTLEAAGLVGLGVATNPPAALLALVVMAIGQGLAVPSLGLLALASVPPSRHGRTAGAFFAYFDAGVGLGGPAVGLAARAADPSGALFAAAVAVVATVPVALLSRAGGFARGGRRRTAPRCDVAT